MKKNDVKKTKRKYYKQYFQQELCNDPNPVDRWQLQELVQALVLLCHHHSVSHFCHATGVLPEIDIKMTHAGLNTGGQQGGSQPGSPDNVNKDDKKFEHKNKDAESSVSYFVYIFLHLIILYILSIYWVFNVLFSLLRNLNNKFSKKNSKIVEAIQLVLILCFCYRF